MTPAPKRKTGRQDAGGTEPVEGLDLEALARFLVGRLDVPGPLGARMIAGGRSNLTYLLTSDGAQWVLRRPPLGHVLPTAHDMGREYRMLSALSETAVPVPRPILLCEDGDVLGAPFYLMEYRDGVVVRDGWPKGFASASDRARTSEALAVTLAGLHAVDWRSAGLGGLARPEPYAARQLRRLRRQWEGSRTEALVGFDELQRRLEASLPPAPPPAIVHGDYHLSNTMLAPDDPGRIVAVLDWELATIGDPLADLGLLIAYWPQADDPPERLAAMSKSALVTTAPGMWSRERVMEAYARASGADLDTLDFYIVLALFKLAVIYQGIHARYVAGVTRGKGFEQYGSRVPLIVDLALQVASSSARLRGS